MDWYNLGYTANTCTDHDYIPVCTRTSQRRKSIPQKSKHLPQNPKTMQQQKIASRMFSMFFQFLLRTFIYPNVPILSFVPPASPPPPKIYFLLGPTNCLQGLTGSLCRRVALTYAVQSSVPWRKTRNPWKYRLEKMTWSLAQRRLCWRVELSGEPAGRRTPTWSWIMRRPSQRPEDKPESGPPYTQEFMTIMVTRSNEKYRDRSNIWRVNFEEPLVTLHTLGPWVPVEALAGASTGPLPTIEAWGEGEDCEISAWCGVSR
jgi:hypothetical protein